MRQIQDFTYLEVVRPIEGGADFLNRARSVAAMVFNSVEGGTLVEVSGDDSAEGESLIVGAPAPSCRVYDSDELDLPLLERKTVPWAHAGGSFSQAHKQLISGKKNVPKTKRKTLDEIEPTFINPPLEQQLLGIQLEHDCPGLDRVPFTVGTIGYRFDEELTNGGLELTLIPGFGDKATPMFIEQAKRCARVLVQTSRKVAYPNGYSHIEIPFARIFEGVDPSQVEEYMEELKKSLPQRLFASMPKIRSHISS